VGGEKVGEPTDLYGNTGTARRLCVVATVVDRGWESGVVVDALQQQAVGQKGKALSEEERD
jgi:hypothetical protein